MASGTHLPCPKILDMASKVDPNIACSVVVYLQYTKKKANSPINLLQPAKCKVDKTRSHNALTKVYLVKKILPVHKNCKKKKKDLKEANFFMWDN